MKKDYEPFVEGTVRCCVCGEDVDPASSDFNHRHMIHTGCFEDPDYGDYEDDFDDYEDDD